MRKTGSSNFLNGVSICDVSMQAELLLVCEFSRNFLKIDGTGLLFFNTEEEDEFNGKSCWRVLIGRYAILSGSSSCDDVTARAIGLMVSSSVRSSCGHGSLMRDMKPLSVGIFVVLRLFSSSVFFSVLAGVVPAKSCEGLSMNESLSKAQFNLSFLSSSESDSSRSATRFGKPNAELKYAN